MHPSEEPLTTLDECAIGVHESFMAYVRAGFTRAEALELTKAHIAAAAANNQED